MLFRPLPQVVYTGESSLAWNSMQKGLFPTVKKVLYKPWHTMYYQAGSGLHTRLDSIASY